MDQEIASFEASIVICPDVLTTGCDLVLQMKVYLDKGLFKYDPATRHSDAFEQKQSTWSEAGDTIVEKRMHQRKVALLKVFRHCGLKPVKTNSILKAKAKSDGVDPDDLGLSYEQAIDMFTQRKSATPPNDVNRRRTSPNAGSSSQVIDLTQETSDSYKPAVKHEIDLTGVISEEMKRAKEESAADSQPADGTEIQEADLQNLYHKAQAADVDLLEAEPPSTFALTLRPYQKQALGWMQGMEKRVEEDEQGQRELSLHPLWEEYAFPMDESDPMAMAALIEAPDKCFYFK